MKIFGFFTDTRTEEEYYRQQTDDSVFYSQLSLGLIIGIGFLTMVVM